MQQIKIFHQSVTMKEVQKIEINGHGDPLRRQRNTRYPQKMALTSSTSGGLSEE
jgi:hypothetical protein